MLIKSNQMYLLNSFNKKVRGWEKYATAPPEVTLFGHTKTDSEERLNKCVVLLNVK